MVHMCWMNNNKLFFSCFNLLCDQHWRCRAKQKAQTVAGSTSSRSDVNTKRVRITHSIHLTKFPIGITYVISIVCLYRNLFVWIQHKIKIIICLANFFFRNSSKVQWIFFFFFGFFYSCCCCRRRKFNTNLDCVQFYFSISRKRLSRTGDFAHCV